MRAYTPLLAFGLLPSSARAFKMQPPTTHQRDAASDCAAWVVAQPFENCELLAKNNQIPLARLLDYVGLLR